MSYKNKTYVIFDGDKDMWAYAYMKGWKTRDHIDFNFHDAHDIRSITDRASEETIKRTLRERFSNAKQVIVIIGESTKNLYRFVRWEIEVALKLGLPVVAVNLNGSRKMDPERCPPILRGEAAVHVSFQMKIIKHALDDFVEDYIDLQASGKADMYYPTAVYTGLGL